jgi:DNA-binding NarL/FixJ family response regulator
MEPLSKPSDHSLPSEPATADALIRVLCVDDHRLMREGIVRILGLQPDMQVVAEASDGDDAVTQFREHRPDVTLMDLQLPTVNGLQAIRSIRAEFPDARIVVLTMYNGDEDIHRAIQAGAVGYLLKDTVPDDLVRVIRDVHAGQRAIPPGIAAALEHRATQPRLTQREFQVLELLATGKRNKEIAAALGISSDTASAHIKSIFIKFNVHDRTAALAEALRRGIIHIGAQ